MDFEDFLKEVTEKLGDRLGESYTFIRQDIDGLNGTKRHSLLVMDKRQDTNIYPCIRMDDYFREYALSGCNIGKIVDEIAVACQKNYMENTDMPDFASWHSIRHNILGKLVNTEKNRCLLENVPHRKYLDLSFVYYAGIHIGSEGRAAVIQIQKEHMEHWGVNEDELYKEAMKNMDREADFNSMENIISKLMGEKSSFIMDGQMEIPMFILSNKQRINGAAQICNIRVMKEIAGYFAGDFWVLPSSIHEVILIPCRWSGPRGKEFAEIVRSVNDTQVLPQEVLSYHVYRYHSRTEEMTVEA